MRTTPKIRLNLIGAAIFILILAAAARPHTVMAEMHQPESAMVMFEPYQGEFPEPEASGFEGVRFSTVGSTLTDFPPNPTRYGYVFDGWQFITGQRNGERLTGNSLVVSESLMTLRAIWVRYGEATTTPPPTATATPSPTPSPSPASPTPTPSAGNKADAGRPNPTTSPIAISVFIFVAVMTLGLAAFGIIKVSARQALAADKYRSDIARYARETRLTDLFKEETQRNLKVRRRKRTHRRWQRPLY